MTSDAAIPKGPRWWVAALLNLLSWFGVGYLYVRHPGRALIVAAVNIVVLAALWHGLNGFFAVPWTMIATIGIGTVLAIAFAVDAARLAKHANAFPARWYNHWWAYVALLVGGFAFALAFDVQYSVHSFYISSASMEPTLRVGDRIFLDKRAYDRRDPARGDVVIFRLPRDPSIFYVKRIVGLPGDEIQMKGGILHLNGTAVPSEIVGEYLQTSSQAVGSTRPGKLIRETLGQGRSAIVLDARAIGDYDNAGPFKVPPGHYFSIGDNRDNSTDSRDQSSRYGVGYVPLANLVGKVAWIYWSGDLSRIGTRVD